jgi:phage gpG-like protein
MSGISIEVDVSDFQGIFRRLEPIFNFEPAELMTTLGALGESQTRRRIAEEKTAPDGTPWKENHEGTSILMKTGQHLLASVAFTASATEAEWGAAWEYAHVHQDGMVIIPKNAAQLAFTIGGVPVFAKSVTIPARPFVGLSADNIAQILEEVTDHFGALQ